MRARASYVLLHGFAGRPESWQPVLDHLPPGTRALTPEILGHGLCDEIVEGAAESQAPWRGVAAESHMAPGGDLETGFEAEGDRLAEVIAGEGFADSHLVGYSLGGRLALGLLVRHGDLFTGGTLLGAHPGLASQRERRERRQGDEAWASKLEDEGLDAFLDAWEAQPLFSNQSPAQRAAQRRLRRRLDPRGLARALRELSLGRMPDYHAALPRLSLPVTWAAGELDGKFRSLAEKCAAATPAGRLQILAGAGHNVVLERPAAVAELLQRSTSLHHVSINALEGSFT